VIDDRPQTFAPRAIQIDEHRQMLARFSGATQSQVSRFSATSSRANRDGGASSN